MRAPRKSRGGALIRLLILIVVGYALISQLPRCTQQLGQMAGNAAARAASQATSSATSGASSALGSWVHNLIDRIESWWTGLSPEERFDKICEHVPVEGVDKVCPYFTAALTGASERDAAQTACYMAAAGAGGQGSQTLGLINKFCPQTPGDPSAFAACVQKYVEPGDASNCLASSPEQFWRAARTMIEPIACPPGVPKSLCTTQPSSQPSASTAAPNPSAPNTSAPASSSTRTDQSYLNCLTYYYQYLRSWGQTSCGSMITAGTAGCARTALLDFTYQGQSVGASQVAQCDSVQP
jgi:hypothetical protein